MLRPGGMGTGGAAGGGPWGIAPWNAPPAEARSLDICSDMVLVSAASSATVLSIELPLDLRTVFVQVGFDAIDRTDLARANWSIKVGGNVLSSHAYLPAAIGYVDAPADCFIHLDRGATVELEVTNGYPLLDCYFQARLVGWIYKPAREEG